MTITELKALPNYEYKNILNPAETSETWGDAQLWTGDNGVELNFCIGETENYSAIYRTYMSDGYAHTDYDTFIPYQIDLTSADWKQELEDAMCDAFIIFNS